VSGGAALLALVAHDQEASAWLWVMVGLLILFNPLVPLHLRHDTWRVLDLLAAGIFVGAAFKLQTHPSRQKREVS
jgi:arginine exporter protein ArgO